MYNHKLIPVIAIGLLSSSAFASGDSSFPVPPGTPKTKDQTLAFDYSCKFKEKNKHDQNTSGDKEIKCWVSGFFCVEKEEKAPSGAIKEDGCEGIENPISIACSDGFKLTVDNSAVAIEDRTLWINADKDKDNDRD